MSLRSVDIGIALASTFGCTQTTSRSGDRSNADARQRDREDKGVLVHSVKRIDQSPLLASRATSGAGFREVFARCGVRARVISVAMVGADVVAFVTATFLAFALTFASNPSPAIRAFDHLTTLGADWHGWGTMLVLVCLLGYFGGRGHYTTRVPSWTQLGDVVIATLVALACDTFLSIAIYNQPVQIEGLLRWVLFAPSLLLLRMSARGVLRMTGLWTLRTLIVADANERESARDALTSDPALGYRVIGTVSPRVAASLPDVELLQMVAARGANFVMVSVGGGDLRAEHAVLDALRRTGLPLALVPALRGMPVVGFHQHYFLGHDIVMLLSSSNLSRPFSRLLKSVFDLTAAGVLVVLFAPLLFGLAMLVRADGGPAFYRHRRIGAGGRVFDCIKFRSMVVNADHVLRQLLARDSDAAAEWAATQKLRRDPRITRIGRFLRRSSLDELPQLFNVLRGEMSLVGPRPIVTSEVARYADDIEYYYAAKPGLTGLWQVSGRNDTSYARRVRLDVWYVRNWTLWHDIAILFKTIPAVFLRRGAH
jgi:Undecaprenyl-phosphate galactose phosphotransferase WbaP